MTLVKGWNAIYLESTPDGDGDCAAFFAGLPVTRVGCYESDAYTATKQYSDDGKELVQKPLSYYVWMADDPDFSTLNALRGGNCYLIYATDACTKTFYGVPAAPRLTWRKADTSGEGFLNLAGVSTALDTSDPSVKLVAAKYFGEGPYGSDNGNGAFYTVGGTSSAAPRFTPSSLFGAPKVQNGKAYALTAVRGGDDEGDDAPARRLESQDDAAAACRAGGELERRRGGLPRTGQGAGGERERAAADERHAPRLGQSGEG